MIVHKKVKNESKVKRRNQARSKIRIKNKPLAKGGTKARCPDISKIKNLGFSKYTLLEEGLRKVVF